MVGRIHADGLSSSDHVYKMFRPDPENETPRDDLDSFSAGNFAKLPRGARAACVSVLREVIPADLAAKWRDQAGRGMRIGSDLIVFHSFGGGMQIRNLLRAVLPDEALPPIKYHPDGEFQNWDDYYGGALQAAFGAA